MAETVTLATVRIDASGVVSGMGDSVAALAGGEGAVGAFTKAASASSGIVGPFITRLFNLRMALMAVTRALGIVGILTTVAYALRRLTVDLISQTTWWKSLKESVTDLYRAWVLGETAIDRISRKMQDAAKEGGGQTIFGTVDQIQKLKDFVFESRRLLGEVMPGSTTAFAIQVDITQAQQKIKQLVLSLEDLGFTAAQAFVFTAADIEQIPTPVPDLLKAAGLTTLKQRARDLDTLAQSARLIQQEFAETGNLARFESGIEAIRQKATGLNATMKEFQQIGIPKFDVFKLANIPSPEEFKEQLQALTGALQFLNMNKQAVGVDLFAKGIANLRDQLEKLLIPLDQYNRLMQLREKPGILSPSELEEINTILSKVNATLASVGITAEGVASRGMFDLREAFRNFADSMSTDQAKWEAFQTALAAVANEISQAFLEGGVTMKQAIVEILKSLARLLITYAVTFTALGIAASTPWGAAFLGPPMPYFKAAATFAVGAVLAGGAARALSGGGGGREGGGGSRNAGGLGSPAAGGRGGPNVTVVVQGSLLGSDPNELARSIAKLISTAQADGAA